MSKVDQIVAEINAKGYESDRRYYELSSVLYDYAKELEMRPTEAVERDAVLEEAAKECDRIKRDQLRCSVQDQWNGPDIAEACAEEVRALKRRDDILQPDKAVQAGAKEQGNLRPGNSPNGD